jgi:hypothetical protein
LSGIVASDLNILRCHRFLLSLVSPLFGPTGFWFRCWRRALLRGVDDLNA